MPLIPPNEPRNAEPLLEIANKGSVWEPSWEPFFADSTGRPWTPVDSKALRSSALAILWTPVDPVWRSTDQEVGCSSRPGRAKQKPLVEAVSGTYVAAEPWPPPCHGSDSREPFCIRIMAIAGEAKPRSWALLAVSASRPSDERLPPVCLPTEQHSILDLVQVRNNWPSLAS